MPAGLPTAGSFGAPRRADLARETRSTRGRHFEKGSNVLRSAPARGASGCAYGQHLRWSDPTCTDAASLLRLVGRLYLLVNSSGQVVETFADSSINGPW